VIKVGKMIFLIFVWKKDQAKYFNFYHLPNLIFQTLFSRKKLNMQQEKLNIQREMPTIDHHANATNTKCQQDN